MGIFMTVTWVSALPRSLIPQGEPELKPEVLSADGRPGPSHAARVQLPPCSEQPGGDALILNLVQFKALRNLCFP